MRLGNFFLLLMTSPWISCMFSQKKEDAIANPDCQHIIDSAKIFVQTSEFAVNYRPTIIDDERNQRLDKWLLKLPFKDFRCLLDHEDYSLKFAGFMYAMNEHHDSLLANYSFLMKDRTQVRLYDLDEDVIKELAFGDLVTNLTEFKSEEDKDFSERPELETKIHVFISRYARYPDSYIPYSFPIFSVGYADDRVPAYKIHHEYALKNNAGIALKLTSAFVFDRNLNINVIEKDSTKFIYSFPPKLEGWLKEFGRELTKKDSLELKL